MVDSRSLLQPHGLNASLVSDDAKSKRRLLANCEFGEHEEDPDIRWFASNFVWLAEERAEVSVEDMSLRLDSSYLTYKAGFNSYDMVLFENYRIKGGNLQKNVLLEWSPGREVSGKSTEVWERRLDLQGTIITNVMLPWTTWNIVTSESAPLEGMMPDILRTLGTALNFTVEWKYPDDGTFGSKGGDGSWTGIVGELVDGKGDISTAGLVITDERVKAIDFSMNFVEDTFKLYHLSTYGSRFSDISIALYLKIFSCSV